MGVLRRYLSSLLTTYPDEGFQHAKSHPCQIGISEPQYGKNYANDDDSRLLAELRLASPKDTLNISLRLST